MKFFLIITLTSLLILNSCSEKLEILSPSGQVILKVDDVWGVDSLSCSIDSKVMPCIVFKEAVFSGWQVVTTKGDYLITKTDGVSVKPLSIIKRNESAVFLDDEGQEIFEIEFHKFQQRMPNRDWMK